jgi:hypothetical protein
MALLGNGRRYAPSGPVPPRSGDEDLVAVPVEVLPHGTLGVLAALVALGLPLGPVLGGYAMNCSR